MINLVNDIIYYYKIFKKTDENDSGELSKEEFIKIVTKDNKQLIKRTVKTINADGDNSIDIYEFFTFLLYDKHLPGNKFIDFNKYKFKRSNLSNEEEYGIYLKERQNEFKVLLDTELNRLKSQFIKDLELRNDDNYLYFKKVFKDTQDINNYLTPASSAPVSSARASARTVSARSASQKEMPPPKKILKILPLNRVKPGNPPQAPLLTERTKIASTKIDENMKNTMINMIKKKIVLVQKFNKNLEEFKKDYENIKELIQISTIYGVSFTNNISPQTITSKLNEIINKKNNNCEKLIKKTNINGFNDNDDLDESIKIFILLCYYINKLNCILNNFDSNLKVEHQSNTRFDNIKSINYLQETLSDIINQRNNINKNDENNKNINSKFIINEKEMSEVCKNINKILEKILNIFIGIHNDLNIKLIQEIIPFSEFNRILRNTKTTTIEGTNKNAYDKLKRTKEYNNLVKEIPNYMNINTMINDLNAIEYSISDYTKLNNYIKFYILLKKQKFETSSTPRTGRNDPPTPRVIKTEQRDKSKQKILRSIRNLIAINYDQIKYPKYEFLNADKIYENKSN
jgi:hypothetical protein